MRPVMQSGMKIPETYFINRHLWRLENLIRGKIQTGVGFTLAPLIACPVERNAWAVSIGGHETTFTRQPTRNELMLDIVNKLLTVAASDTVLYFGGWSHEGIYYFDLSRLIADRAEAITFASTSGQQSIYNLVSGETHFLPQPFPENVKDRFVRNN